MEGSANDRFDFGKMGYGYIPSHSLFLGRYHCLVLSNNLHGLGVLTNLVLWVFVRCKHYRRRCKIRAPCCNEIYPCRHCHNEATVGKGYYICIEILELSCGFCASSWSWCLLFFMDLLEYVEKPFWSAWTRSMRRQTSMSIKKDLLVLLFSFILFTIYVCCCEFLWKDKIRGVLFSLFRWFVQFVTQSNRYVTFFVVLRKAFPFFFVAISQILVSLIFLSCSRLLKYAQTAASIWGNIFAEFANSMMTM